MRVAEGSGQVQGAERSLVRNVQGPKWGLINKAGHSAGSIRTPSGGLERLVSLDERVG